MAGLKEISQASGVSIRTASRVLKENGYASPEARKAVLQAAEELGYRPNRFARSLKTQKGYEVVVLAWSFDELHMAKIAGLENSLRQLDYSVSMVFEHPVSKKKDADKIIEEVSARNPAGVVIFPLGGLDDSFWAKGFGSRNIPYVFIDSRDETVDSVRIDRQQGVYESVLYLAAAGRKRIAYLGPDDPTRLVGYNRAMRQLDREPILIITREFDEDFEMITQKAVNSTEMPDAIQAYSDRVAMLFIARAHELGIKIPDELAVVGFDDRQAAELCWPALTTVAQPNRRVGELTAEMITRKIEGQSAPVGGWSISVPTKLVKRNSA